MEFNIKISELRALMSNLQTKLTFEQLSLQRPMINSGRNEGESLVSAISWELEDHPPTLIGLVALGMWGNFWLQKYNS